MTRGEVKLTFIILQIRTGSCGTGKNCNKKETKLVKKPTESYPRYPKAKKENKKIIKVSKTNVIIWCRTE